MKLVVNIDIRMKLLEFDYYLPKELIAQEPLARRDASRLLVVDRKTRTISHRSFKDLAGYFKPKDLLVLNNTRVIPARLLGVKKDTLGKVDVLLVERLSDKRFKVLIKPHLKIGGELIFSHGTVRAQLVEDKVLEFKNALSEQALKKIGLIPLPPYIKRQPGERDSLRYQTVYARNPGAIAAPTAGLHFTRELLKEIEEKEVKLAHITLHAGVGTFKPVRSEDIRNHIMEPEEFNISQKTIKDIITIKEKGGRVFAVGTTTTRALETAAAIFTNHACPPKPWRRRKSRTTNHCGYTNLFIYPGYKFKIVDCLLTNFHLPKTTLLMLVCAFASSFAGSEAGRDRIMQAYQEAIKEKYRFYSYGDAMLII